MFIWESAFLGLEQGKVVLKNNFSSYLGGVGSPAWITYDNYKDGRKENGIRYSRINVNLSNMDNHFSFKKKNSLVVVNISLKGKHSKAKSGTIKRKAHSHIQNYCRQ
jgi:hypothetical protein